VTARTVRSVSLPARSDEPPARDAAMTVRFGPLPFSAMRRVQRVLTDEPNSRLHIAEACGCRLDRTSAILTRLVRSGLALKLDAGYVRSERSPDPVQDDAVPMEIGRQILACLTEPRRTRDIARIINRPPSNTTGQLQHLLRRGLVVRVSKGVYDLAPSNRKSGPAAQGAERSRTSAQRHPSMERPGSGASLSHSDGA
jgi:hypothetical protein